MDDELDRALASYSDVEPLAGLEQRVLDRVRDAPVQVQRRYWSWAALAVCAAAMCAWLVIPVSQVPTPLPPGPKMISSARAPMAAVISSPPVRRVRVKRHVHDQRSQEEKLLARYAASDPEGLEKAMTTLRASAERNLDVPEITTEPIQIATLP